MLIGEGLYGRIHLADTTNTSYWVTEAAVGAAIVGYVVVRERTPRAAASWAVVAALTAAVVYTVATHA